MEKYTNNFIENGYDNIQYLGGGVVKKEYLMEIGIEDQKVTDGKLSLPLFHSQFR